MVMVACARIGLVRVDVGNLGIGVEIGIGIGSDARMLGVVGSRWGSGMIRRNLPFSRQ